MMCFLFVSFFYKLKAGSSTSEMIKTRFIKTVALLLWFGTEPTISLSYVYSGDQLPKELRMEEE